MKYAIYLLCTLLALFASCKDKTTETEHAHEHEEASNVVELSAAQYKTAAIKLGKVEMKNLSASLQVSGMLDIPPQNLVSVSALMGGFIKSTDLLQGMKVHKGQVIATIQNPDFIEIQQDFLENLSKLHFAEQEYKRQEELAKENVAAQKTMQQTLAEYQSLKATNSGLLEKLSILGITPASLEQGNIRSTVSIVAPISGYVTTVNVNIGKFVNPQDVICEIVDPEHMHVELTVFEKDLGKIKIGQKIRFVLINESDKERTAKVYLINHKISEDRTVRIHAHMDKEDASLIPFMYLKAYIETGEQALTALPDEAIVSSGGKHYIFTNVMDHVEPTHGDSKHHEEAYSFQAIEVVKGISQNGYTAITLPESFDLKNVEVVVKGAYDLLSKMNNSEEEEHSH
jgi:membrane fusion protein, heavy metal efflux system